MTVHHDTFEIHIDEHDAMVNVTRDVAGIVAVSGVVSGICTVFVPHTTAAVTINENADPAVVEDMLAWLSKLVPKSDAFRHAEGNSDGHIKASLIGNSLQVAVVDGHLRLGTWQGIYLCEFDGPRRRRLEVTVMG